jgi:DNA-binding transcriptional LysR family regulator
VNISQLRAFVEVTHHHSFSEAARVLGLSQPAVTMQIQSLESDLGVTLLERKYRKVELTEAGRALLPHANKVLGEVQDARDELEHLAETITGHLLLAASTTPGQYVLPKLLGTFLRQNPDVSASLVVGDTAEVVRLVETGEAHLGMTGARLSGTKVEYVEVAEDRLVLISSPDSPLARRKAVPLAEVAEEPFIVREHGSGTRMVFEEALREGGVEPSELEVVMDLATSEAIVSAVEGGMGLGVVSHWMADKAIALKTVALVDCPHFPVVRPLYAVVPAGNMRHAAHALLAHLQDSLAS